MHFICKDESLKEFLACFICHIFLVTSSLCFGKCMHPCIPPCTSVFHLTPSSFSPPTGNRWEVKGVTCRGSGLLPLACQRLITYTHTHKHTQNAPYPRGPGKSQLGAITGAVQTHTSIYTWTHPQPRKLMGVFQSDTRPPLTLFVSFLIIISTHLTTFTIIITTPRLTQVSILPITHIRLRALRRRSCPKEHWPQWSSSCQSFLPGVRSPEIKIPCPSAVRATKSIW